MGNRKIFPGHQCPCLIVLVGKLPLVSRCSSWLFGPHFPPTHSISREHSALLFWGQNKPVCVWGLPCSHIQPLTSPSGTEVRVEYDMTWGSQKGLTHLSVAQSLTQVWMIEHTLIKGGRRELDVQMYSLNETRLWFATLAVLRPGPQCVVSLLSRNLTLWWSQLIWHFP